MTDDEINRKFDIVADHLVSLAVSQQESNERIGRGERVLLLGIKAWRRERKEAKEKFDALAAAQAHTEAALAKPAESLAHTNKRLEDKNEKGDGQPPTEDDE